MANMPQSASDLFDSLLPLGLDAYPDRAKELDAVFSFVIEENTQHQTEGASKWTLDCKSTPPRIHKGDGPNPAQVTIEMSHDDLKALMKDPFLGVDFYFQNRLRITGDGALCLRLSTFFDITRPNPGPAVTV